MKKLRKIQFSKLDVLTVQETSGLFGGITPIPPITSPTVTVTLSKPPLPRPAIPMPVPAAPTAPATPAPKASSSTNKSNSSTKGSSLEVSVGIKKNGPDYTLTNSINYSGANGLYGKTEVSIDTKGNQTYMFTIGKHRSGY